MIKEILEKFNNFAIYGTLVLIFLCFIFYNILFLAGDPNRKSELRLYDVLVFIIITIVVVNIVLVIFSYISTKNKKGIYGSRGIEGAPGEKGEVGTCNTDCGKKVCIGVVLEENNKYLNKLLHGITSEYIPFSNYLDEKIEKVTFNDTINNVVVDRKTRLPSKFNDRALAIYSNDSLDFKEGDSIIYIDFGIHTNTDDKFPKTNLGSLKVKENFFVKITKTSGEEIILKPGEYDRLELDEKNLDKTDNIEKIVIETEIQNKFLINKLNKICHSDNYQKMLERPGKRKINEKKLIEYITDITKKWIKELFNYRINLTKNGEKVTVYAGLRFLLEPNFKIEMLKNYKDSAGKTVDNPFYTYKPSPDDDTKFIESKGEILKFDIWNWSEQYYTNKPVITKCFNKKNLPKDEQPPVSIMSTNDYIPIYTGVTSPDLYNVATCPYGQLNDDTGIPTNPKEKTHCIYLEPNVTFDINEDGESVQHIEYSKKLTRAWKDKKVYKPENEVSLYHPKHFTDKQGRKFFPVGSVWTGTNDINKPKFSDHTPESDSACSAHGKYGPKKETILVSGDVKPPLSYNLLWSSDDINVEIKADVKIKGAVFYKGKDQGGDNYQLPNNIYTKLNFKKIVPGGESCVVKPNNLLRIDYIEDDGLKGFDEFVTGGYNFDNYRQYNKIDYKFQFIPSTAKTYERNFPPIKNGATFYLLSLNYNNQEFHFLRDVNGRGEITTTPPHNPVELFQHANYKGLQLNFGTGPSKVGALFDRASSFKIAIGYWVTFCDWNSGSTVSQCSTHWHPSRSTEKRTVYGPRDASWIEQVGLENDNLDFVNVNQIPDLYFYGSRQNHNNMKMTVLYKGDYYFSIKSGNGRFLNLKNGINFTSADEDTLEFYEHTRGSICIRSITFNKILYFDSTGKAEAKPFTPYIDLADKVTLGEVKNQFIYFADNENQYLQDNGEGRDIIFSETEQNPFQRHTVKYYKNDAFTIKGLKSYSFLTAGDDNTVKFLNKEVGDSELFMFYGAGSIPYKTDGIPLTETEVFIKSYKYNKYLKIQNGKLVLGSENKLRATPFKVIIEEIDESLQKPPYTNAKVWRPVDPPGYRCLGDVVTKSNESPSNGENTSSIMCVPESCVEEVPIINKFYHNNDLKVEINTITSDMDIVVKKEIKQKPMELYNSGASGAYEENKHREEQDYEDDGGHNLFRFSENGLPNKNLGLKVNRSCLKNRTMKNVQPKNANNVLNMIDTEREHYKKTGNYFKYPLDAYIENRRVDDVSKIINENKSYYLQYASEKPLSTKQIEQNKQKIEGSPKARGDGLYFIKASGKDRNEFDNCLVVENGQLVRSDICNMANKNHLWELMDFKKFNEEDAKFGHGDKTEIELRSLGSENKCFQQTYNDKGIIKEALVNCKLPTVEDDKKKFSWMYRSIDSNDSIDSFEEASS